MHDIPNKQQDGRYRLTKLQRVPKDLSHGQLRRERARATELRHLYELASRIQPRLDISHEAIAYYASLVSYYTATRLNDLDTSLVYVYLLCFLQQRYHRLHDHLLSGLMHAVKDYRDDPTSAVKAQAVAYRVSLTQDMIRGGQVLQYFTDEQIPPELPFATLQERAFALVERERLINTATYMASGVGCDETAFFWQHLDTLARRFKGRLRPLLREESLTASQEHSALMEVARN